MLRSASPPDGKSNSFRSTRIGTRMTRAPRRTCSSRVPLETGRDDDCTIDKSIDSPGEGPGPDSCPHCVGGIDERILVDLDDAGRTREPAHCSCHRDSHRSATEEDDVRGALAVAASCQSREPKRRQSVPQAAADVRGRSNRAAARIGEGNTVNTATREAVPRPFDSGFAPSQADDCDIPSRGAQSFGVGVGTGRRTRPVGEAEVAGYQHPRAVFPLLNVLRSASRFTAQEPRRCSCCRRSRPETLWQRCA